MKKTWMVTGCAGFLGHHIVKKLLQKNVKVIGVDNLAWGSRKNMANFIESKNFIFENQDILNVEKIDDIFKRYCPNVIVHLSALHFIPWASQDPEKTISINILGTQIILSAATKNNVEAFWFASTGDVYFPSENSHKEEDETSPNNIYGLSKLTGEKLIEIESKRNPKIKFIIGRLFNLYGEGETNPHIIPEIISQLKKGRPFKLSLGNIWPKRDFVPVSEAAESVIKMVENAKSAFTLANLATGNARSIEDLIHEIESILDEKIHVEQDPSKLRAVERPHLQADVSKLKNLIGQTPSSKTKDDLISLLVEENILQKNAKLKTA